MSRIPDNLQKSALSRLACYCSVKRIAPDKVDGRALLGLHRALDAECATKNPRNIVKRTISVWPRRKRSRSKAWRDDVRAPVSSFTLMRSTPSPGRPAHSRQPRTSGGGLRFFGLEEGVTGVTATAIRLRARRREP